jgi:FkbM family methyltransferase
MSKLFRFFLMVVPFLSGPGLWANVYYEGTVTFGNYGKVDLGWMQQLLPYNPIIVEVGAYCGAETSRAAQIWPKSKIFAFEPNPRAYALLKKAVSDQKLDNVQTFPFAVSNQEGIFSFYLCYGPTESDLTYEPHSSLLPPAKVMESEYKGPAIDVPCVVLDQWCSDHQIDHIDILRLETEGMELAILKSSPQILQDVKIIYLQSFFSPLRMGMVDYFQLKNFLVKSGFVPLAHWYTQGYRGSAVYVSLELYEAYFVRCLGLGSGGISLP